MSLNKSNIQLCKSFFHLYTNLPFLVEFFKSQHCKLNSKVAMHAHFGTDRSGF
jgi:hypothetical protein